MATINTMPNNILVGSEKLFRSKNPWRINSSLIGLLSPGHNLLLFNTNNRDDFDRKKTQRLATVLYDNCQVSHGNVIFMGLENECRMGVDLQFKYGYDFDCIVLVNNPYDEAMYENLSERTLLYNFYTNSNGFDLAGAHINQKIKTVLPAQMSKRFALEMYGCLLYDTYGQNCFDDVYGPIKYV